MKNITLNDSVLAQLLGVDGMEELKTKIIDIIVEQVRNDFEQYSEWIISPDDIHEILNDYVINDVVDKVKDEYSEKVKTIMEEKLKNVFNEL